MVRADGAAASEVFGGQGDVGINAGGRLDAITGAGVEEFGDLGAREGLGSAEQFSDEGDARQMLDGLHVKECLVNVLAISDRAVVVLESAGGCHR